MWKQLYCFFEFELYITCFRNSLLAYLKNGFWAFDKYENLVCSETLLTCYFFVRFVKAVRQRFTALFWLGRGILTWNIFWAGAGTLIVTLTTEWNIWVKYQDEHKRLVDNMVDIFKVKLWNYKINNEIDDESEIVMN